MTTLQTCPRKPNTPFIIPLPNSTHFNTYQGSQHFTPPNSFEIVPTVPSPEDCVWDNGKKPSGYVHVTKSNQQVEFWDRVVNIPKGTQTA